MASLDFDGADEDIFEVVKEEGDLDIGISEKSLFYAPKDASIREHMMSCP